MATIPTNMRNVLVDAISGGWLNLNLRQTTYSGVEEDHSMLYNLEFENSGHTGFASSAELALTSGTLQDAIDDIVVGAVSWEAIQNKPSTFTPSVHGDEAHSLDYALYSELTTASGVLQDAIDNIDLSAYATTIYVDTVSGSLQDQIDNLTPDHASLTNLDYASSGHTGFQPAGDYATNSGVNTISGSIVDQIPTDYISDSEITTISGNIVSQIITDHGGLTGLSNDDHPQYALTNGSRDITGQQNFNDNVVIRGNLVVSGTQVITEVEDVLIEDHLLTLNYGETASGISFPYAGIEIERGTATNYLFVYDETDDNFQVGVSGSLQPVATREDTPISSGIALWNASLYRLDTVAQGTAFNKNFGTTAGTVSEGNHTHDDRYYTETEVDTISGALNTKISTKITASDVTYENLSANGDVGTGADQVAIGTHSHDYATTVHVHSGIISDIGNSPLGQKVEAFCYDTGNNPNDAHFAVRIDGINMLSVYNYSYVGVKFRDGEYIVGFENTITGTRSNVVPTEQAVVTYVGTNTHTRSHTMTSTSDHTAGNYKVFYSNSSGQVVELALGDNGKVFTSNGATSAPTFETPPATVDTFLELTDTPAAYTSQAGKFVRVNSGETALEFTASSASDDAAIHDDTTGEINAITEKTTPASTDVLLIEDSAASYAKKKLQITNLPIDISKDTTPQLGGDLDTNGKNIVMTPSPSSDDTACGDIATLTVDTNGVGVGAALFMASDGNFDEADADQATTMPCVALALETGTGSKKVLLRGFIRNDDWSWTVGGLIYVSSTQGTMTQTAPAGTGDQVQIVGFATHADRMFFNPNYALAEVK